MILAATILAFSFNITSHISIVTDSSPIVETVSKKESSETVQSRFPTPSNYKRVATQNGTFANYLQSFKLKPHNTPVYLYNGEKKWYQDAVAGVLDIDVGTRDLQQCADAVMRLKAEYHYERKEYSKIHFNFVSDGKPRYFDYKDKSYPSYRKFMNYVFAYANTRSLKNELIPKTIENIQPGDVFIQSGNPYGHAMIVMDVCQNSSGNKQILLAQSYMPAQDIHIVKNPASKNGSPWFDVRTNKDIVTAEWTFESTDLRRFPNE